MPLNNSQADEYKKLNEKKIESQIPGLKCSIFKGLQQYLRHMERQIAIAILQKEGITRPVRPAGPSGALDADFNRTLGDYYAQVTAKRTALRLEEDLLLWNKLLSGGQYAFSAFRHNIDSIEGMPESGAYMKLDENARKTLAPTEETIDSAGQWFVEKLTQIKPGKVEVFKLDINLIGTEPLSIFAYEAKMSEIAACFIASFYCHGVYLNTGHHMTSFNGIIGKLGLFQYRLNEVWFQEAGKNKMKEVKKADKNNKEKFSAFSEYGISRQYYHHLRMINYPKEVKSKNRNMVGVGSDIIDLIEYYRNPTKGLKDEDKKIIAALKNKTMFWKNTSIIEDFAKLMERFDDNKDECRIAVGMMIQLINMRHPTIEFRYSMPARAILDLDVESLPDFSAQGAFLCYKKLQEKSVTTPFVIKSVESGINFTYAIVIAMFDLLQADQRLVMHMFATEPKSRADFGPRPYIKDENKKITITLPQIKYWSKVYKGERGLGGEEQSGVLHPVAAATIYRGNDFIISHGSSLFKEEFGFGRSNNLMSVLKSELQNISRVLSSGTLKLGTQSFYTVADLGKANVDLPKGDPHDFTKGAILPFYTQESYENRGVKRGLNNGGESLSKRVML